MYNKYEEREIAKFKRETYTLKDLPLKERKENGEIFTKYLNDYLPKVLYSIEWTIDGCYGHGAYLEAKKVLKNKRLNRNAWLFITVAALEWRVEDVRARKIWNSLSSALQENINFAIDQIIKEWEKENL